MNFDTTPPPDPELEREKAAARKDKIDAIRDQVSYLTEQLVKSYGSKAALTGGGGSSGGGMTRPPILSFGT